MQSRQWLAPSLVIAAVCGMISLAVTPHVVGPVVASGATPTTSGLLAMILPLLGTAGGLIGAIISWLQKPTIKGVLPIIDQITPNIGGEHTAVLGAIIAGLNFSSGRAAESKGEASLNGGTLVWSFTFTPDAATAPVPNTAK